MFPILLMKLTMKPARVKTEASFTAEDPWNQNQRSPFTVEAYMLTYLGAAPKARAVKAFKGPYRFGIRSDADGVERMLPECLAHLWHDHRVPADALPRLLKEMTPMLKKSDFNRTYLDKSANVARYAIIGLFVFMLLMVGGLIAITAEGISGMVYGAIIFVFVALLLAGVFHLGFSRPRARRRRQMDWALSHV
jgi:hypothetical protein